MTDFLPHPRRTIAVIVALVGLTAGALGAMELQEQPSFCQRVAQASKWARVTRHGRVRTALERLKARQCPPAPRGSGHGAALQAPEDREDEGY